MSHTPGPWRVEPDLSNIGLGGVVTADKSVKFSERGYYEAEYMRIEDARLIAAAPDLLAVCKAVLGHLDGSTGEIDAVEILRQAIAKA